MKKVVVPVVALAGVAAVVLVYSAVGPRANVPNDDLRVAIRVSGEDQRCEATFENQDYKKIAEFTGTQGKFAVTFEVSNPGESGCVAGSLDLTNVRRKWTRHLPCAFSTEARDHVTITTPPGSRAVVLRPANRNNDRGHYCYDLHLVAGGTRYPVDPEIEIIW